MASGTGIDHSVPPLPQFQGRFLALCWNSPEVDLLYTRLIEGGLPSRITPALGSRPRRYHHPGGVRSTKTAPHLPDVRPQVRDTAAKELQRVGRIVSSSRGLEAWQCFDSTYRMCTGGANGYAWPVRRTRYGIGYCRVSACLHISAHNSVTGDHV